MISSCPFQFFNGACGSISTRTVEPRVSARHFVLPVETGSGAIIMAGRDGSLKAVSSIYFSSTRDAAFSATESLNGQTPVTKLSNSFLDDLRIERPRKKIASSG